MSCGVAAGMLESNQCGIETKCLVWAVRFDARLESNQCGIETLSEECVNEFRYRLESNQCGIETSSYAPHPATPQQA